MAALLNPYCICLRLSCEGSNGEESSGRGTARRIHRIQRRNLLISLGGLYADARLTRDKAATAGSTPTNSYDQIRFPELERQVIFPENLNSPQLGYNYQEIDPFHPMSASPISSSSSSGTRGEFPRTLDSVIKSRVRRPKKSRSREEKEAEEEVLVIDQIQLPREAAVKFDVYINVEDEGSVGPGSTEFVGSFVNVPQIRLRPQNPMRLSTCLRLGITYCLDELGADGDDELEVTLVPRLGTDGVTIGGMRIEFLS